MVCPPLYGVVCRGHAQYPAFAPDPLLLLPALQKWQLVFLVSCYLLTIILPHCRTQAVIFSPIQFLYICCSRRGVSRGKYCSTAAKGPGSQASLNTK